MRSMNSGVAECVATAREAIEIEAEAIALAARRVDEEFVRAVQLILQHKGGKVVVTGVGKSGLIGRKIVSTLRSTGTQAVFMHPVEAAHGDLGIYAPEDPTILISKSGTTSELTRLIPILREFRSPLIGILGGAAGACGPAVHVAGRHGLQDGGDLLHRHGQRRRSAAGAGPAAEGIAYCSRAACGACRAPPANPARMP